MYSKNQLAFYAVLVLVCIIALCLMAAHASFSVNLLPMF